MARLPIFPLGTIAVPGATLALRLFEPRYLALLRDLGALPVGEQRFGVLAIAAGNEIGPGRATTLFGVGTVVEIVTVATGPGSVLLEAIGRERFRLEALDDHARPYAMAEVELLPEPLGEQATDRAARVRAAYAAYARLLGGRAVTENDPVALSYAVLERMRLDLADRQAVLEVPDASGRLALLARLLDRELRLVRHFGALPGSPGPVSAN